MESVVHSTGVEKQDSLCKREYRLTECGQSSSETGEMFSTFGSLEKEDKYIEGIIQSVFGQDNPDGMLYQYRELSSSTHPTEIECAGQPVTDMIVESTTGETVQKTDFTETKSLSPDSTQHPSSSTCDTESKPVTKFYLPPCKTCNVQQSTGLHYGEL